MSKKLSKAETTFHRDVKEQLEHDSNEHEGQSWRRPNNTPVFIPRRKKFKH